MGLNILNEKLKDNSIKNEELYVFYSKDIRGLSNSKVKYINDIELAGAIRASCSYPRNLLTI